MAGNLQLSVQNIKERCTGSPKNKPLSSIIIKSY